MTHYHVDEEVVEDLMQLKNIGLMGLAEHLPQTLDRLLNGNPKFISAERTTYYLSYKGQPSPGSFDITPEMQAEDRDAGIILGGYRKVIMNCWQCVATYSEVIGTERRKTLDKWSFLDEDSPLRKLSARMARYDQSDVLILVS
jgi:hypothetical protein